MVTAQKREELYAGAILTSAMYVFDTRSGKLINTISFQEKVRPFAVSTT